jgi:2'-5' RNA ligase
MPMKTVRSFIAIELPEETRKEIGSLQTRLKMNDQNYIKWVSPDSMHLTLKFLGDIDTAKTGEILEAIEESVAGVSPFRLKISGLGVFPNLKRIQVVWVGISGEINTLRQIQNDIETILAVLGYPEEGREFTPHLTLGRVRYSVPSQDMMKFANIITSTIFEIPGEIIVDSINLIESQLRPSGAIYTKIGSAQLKSH